MEQAKTILVTGASRGIGRALATAAAGAGHHVVVNYRSDMATVKALAADLDRGPGGAIAVEGDVTEPHEVERLVHASLAFTGRLDCVVNNAGVGSVIDLEALDTDTFSRMPHDNLTSAFLVSQAAWPHMTARDGRLVFMSSGAARSGGGLSAAYAASKAGLERLMHFYAARLHEHRITANAIAPAMIESDITRAMARRDGDALPLGRLGRADELWPALRMILETEYLTGQTIHVDAGRIMT